MKLINVFIPLVLFSIVLLNQNPFQTRIDIEIQNQMLNLHFEMKLDSALHTRTQTVHSCFKIMLSISQPSCNVKNIRIYLYYNKVGRRMNELEYFIRGHKWKNPVGWRCSGVDQSGKNKNYSETGRGKRSGKSRYEREATILIVERKRQSSDAFHSKRAHGGRSYHVQNRC